MIFLISQNYFIQSKRQPFPLINWLACDPHSLGMVLGSHFHTFCCAKLGESVRMLSKEEILSVGNFN